MPFDLVNKYNEFQSLVSSRIIGFERISEALFISLVTKGHVLLEGPPGVAKTVLAKTFSSLLNVKFKRIQFTPDLLPMDILGSVIYDQSSRDFRMRFGPIFTNVLLADEINRASPKTQSALLEAMEERQITIEGSTNALEDPFMVIATQNPVEQEGTFPLPEAQLDRFLFKININYPKEEEEIKILRTKFALPSRLEGILDKNDIAAMSKRLSEIYVSDKVFAFISKIVSTIRSNPSVAWGPSPRASISLVNVAKVLAMLEKRSYVLPKDVVKFAEWILNHRFGIASEYELEGTTGAEIVKKTLEGTDAA